MAVQEAINSGKAMSALRECRATSMVFPGSEKWTDIVATFESGKLAQDIATKQFSETLPLLSDAKLKIELEAREKLANSLHVLTSMELLAANYDSCDLFPMLAKAHLPAVVRNLQEFANARRALRVHTFMNAKVRHEPNRLINSSLWGAGLFPEEIVKEILAKAASENRSLL